MQSAQPSADPVYGHPPCPVSRELIQPGNGRLQWLELGARPKVELVQLRRERWGPKGQKPQPVFLVSTWTFAGSHRCPVRGQELQRQGVRHESQSGHWLDPRGWEQKQKEAGGQELHEMLVGHRLRPGGGWTGGPQRMDEFDVAGARLN